MKIALLVYISGLLLVAVFGTTKIKCGANMELIECTPCNPVCNKPPPICSRLCRVNTTACQCIARFSLPKPDSTYCIPTKECSPKCSNQ